MRGEVLRYDDNSGEGLISGDDGGRYKFQRTDLQQLVPVRAGARVDFDAIDGHARDVFLITAGAAGTAGVAAATAATAGGAAFGEPRSAAPAYSAQPSHIDERAGPGMWGYFTKCMRMYADGSGRAQRAEYWSFLFFVYIFVIVAVIADFFWNAAAGILDEEAFFPILTVLVFLGFMIPSICVTIRRLHDLGMTGWLYLINFIPYIGGLFIFVVSLIPSQQDTNKHGPHPKAVLPSADVFS